MAGPLACDAARLQHAGNLQQSVSWSCFDSVHSSSWHQAHLACSCAHSVSSLMQMWAAEQGGAEAAARVPVLSLPRVYSSSAVAPPGGSPQDGSPASSSGKPEQHTNGRATAGAAMRGRSHDAEPAQGDPVGRGGAGAGGAGMVGVGGARGGKDDLRWMSSVLVFISHALHTARRLRKCGNSGRPCKTCAAREIRKHMHL